MSSSDVSNTLKVSNIESGTKINTSAARIISNGKQIIVECKKGLFHTPIYLENPLTLFASAGNVYNKIVFRNCLVIGSIIMNAKTVVILDNSSLGLTPKISSTNGSPSYIAMMNITNAIITKIALLINNNPSFDPPKFSTNSLS